MRGGLPMDGVKLFLKHAIPPNLFRFCGPSNPGKLVEIFNAGDTSGKNFKNEFLLKFKGAIPHLQILAKTSRLDMFDYQVVEAYWIGNNLLNNVFGDITPYHLCHVFKTHEKFLRDHNEIVLASVNRCRIAWGKVEAIVSATARVSFKNLVFNEKGQLDFGERVFEDFVVSDSLITKGDIVSLHHGFVCCKLTVSQVTNIAAWSRYYLKMTNDRFLI